MRLGRISFKTEYVVDLDNDEMVDHAKEAISEDLQSAATWGHTLDIKEDETLTENDIADFLMEEVEEEEY